MQKLQDAFEDFMDRQGGEWFDSKVVGVTYPNPDGSDRQAIVRTLAEMDELQLDPEPENAFDPNAIAVKLADGRQVGYVDGRLAKELCRLFRRGGFARCFVRTLRESRGMCGVSIGIAVKPAQKL